MKDISVKKQYILKFVLVMLIPLMAVSVVFYCVHLRTVKQDVVDMEYYRLDQARESMDARLKEMLEAALKIRADKRLLPASLSGDAYLRTTVKNILYSHNATNKLCDNVQIYYRAFDGVYSEEGFTSLSPFLRNRYSLADADAQALTEMLKTCCAMTYAPFNAGGERVWAFLYPMQYYRGSASMTIFYIVKADAFREKIAYYLESDPGVYAALLSENGDAIFSCADALSGEFARAYPSGARGMLESRLNGEAYTLIYVTSETNLWRYVSALPSRALLRGVERQKLLLIQIGVMTLFLGIGMALMLARNVWQPIKGLADTVGVRGPGNEIDAIRDCVLTYRDSYTQISQLLDKHKPFLVDFAIEQLLSGHISAETCAEKLSEAGISMDHPVFFAAALAIAREGEEVPVSEAHEAVLQAAINVNAENATELNVLTLEQRYENTILILFNAIYEWDQVEYLSAFVKKLQAARVWEFVVLGAGGAYPGLEALSRSYTEAMIAQKQLAFSGGRGMLLYRDILRADAPSADAEQREWEMRLLQYVRQGNATQARETLRLIFARLGGENQSYMFARAAMVRMANDMVRQAREISEDAFAREIELALRLRDLRQFSGDLIALAEAMCAYVEKSRASSGRQLGESMLKYVSDHFRDTDLSLETMAENFQLSSFYVSRFFSQYANTPFREYVTKLRIGEAQRLLRDTDMAVKDIVREIGYLDPSTFTRKFKQVLGVTPGEYRAGTENKE